MQTVAQHGWTLSWRSVIVKFRLLQTTMTVKITNKIRKVPLCLPNNNLAVNMFGLLSLPFVDVEYVTGTKQKGETIM